MKNLMYAEIEEITPQMQNDVKSVTISDTGLFLVTTKENAEMYENEEFFPVDEDGYEAYQEIIDNKLNIIK